MIVVSGPIAQSAPIVVAPLRNVLGSMTVSRPIVTSASMPVESGSTIVTPLRACRSWICFWASLRTWARSTRSLTPSVSVAIGDEVRVDRLAGLDQLRQHVRQVQLALGVVGVDLAERGEQARAVERVHARVDLADLELLGRRVALGLDLDDAFHVAVACHGRRARTGRGRRAPWSPSSPRRRSLRGPRPGPSSASRGDQRHVAGEHDDRRVGVDVRTGGRDRVTRAVRLLLDGDDDALRQPVLEPPLRVVDHHDLPGARLLRGEHGPQDQRAAADRVQDLGQRRAHARSFAGGDDDDGGRGHRSHRSIGLVARPALGSRLMAGLWVLVPAISVRIRAPQFVLPFESVRRVDANICSCHATRSTNSARSCRG